LILPSLLCQELQWSVTFELTLLSHLPPPPPRPACQKQNGHDHHLIEPISPYTPLATALTSPPTTAPRSSAKKNLRHTPATPSSPPSSTTAALSSSKRRSHSKSDTQAQEEVQGQGQRQGHGAPDDSFYHELADQLYDEQIRVTHLTGKINELHRLEEEQRERVKELAVERDR
jgi:hypothetical protein